MERRLRSLFMPVRPAAGISRGLLCLAFSAFANRPAEYLMFAAYSSLVDWLGVYSVGMLGKIEVTLLMLERSALLAGLTFLGIGLMRLLVPSADGRLWPQIPPKPATRCAVCGYHLSGLPQHHTRCPECGQPIRVAAAGRGV